MEWRCEWCGKPHEENDPPCDNCGHGSFEQAVVPVASGEPGSAATVWVCTDCGREHTKHSPPCSRCGNQDLERRVQEFDDSETAVPGYLDLLTPRYAVAFVAVAALAGLFVLGVTGLVSVPGFGTGVPEVADVPGNASAAGGVSLADAERAYLARLDAERRAAGRTNLTRRDDLDDVATFYNKRRVKTRLGDGSLPGRDRMRDLLGSPCRGGEQILLVSPRVGPDAYGSATDLGRRLAVAAVERERGDPVEADGSRTGVDIHAGPDGTVYLVQFVC